MTSQSKYRTYTKKERNMYLVAMCGQNLIYNVIGTGLTFYLQSVIFLPAMAISVFMAIARVWDAINDPMMGTIVDKTKSKWGKCRPYLLFCPALICVITVLCFVNGFYSKDAATLTKVAVIGWAAVSYILWGMSYTIGDIPLWGITSLMTEDPDDRASILSLARIFGGVGAAPALLALVQLSQGLGRSLESSHNLDFNHSQKYGFLIVVTVMTLIGTAMFQLAGIFTRERVEQNEKRYSLKENFKTMWSNVPFRRLIVSSVIRSPIQLLMTVAISLLNYYFGDFGMKDYTVYLIILGGAIFIAQFAASAIAPKLCKKHEKKKVYNLSTFVSAICFGLIFVVYKLAPTSLDQPIWVAANFVLFAGAGAGMGMLNVLQSIIIADSIDYEEYTNGVRPDGVFFSGQSFATKLSSGIASIIQGVAYSIVGFSSDNIEKCNNALQQGASFKHDFPQYASIMFFLCSVPPAIGLLLSILPMRKYELTNEKHQEILDTLVEKRRIEKEILDSNKSDSSVTE